MISVKTVSKCPSAVCERRKNNPLCDLFALEGISQLHLRFCDTIVLRNLNNSTKFKAERFIQV